MQRRFFRSLRLPGQPHCHKLIVYPQAGVTLLFELKRDPLEMDNLSARRIYNAQARTR